MKRIRFLLASSGDNQYESFAKEIEIFEQRNKSIKVDIELLPWRHIWREIVNHTRSKKGPDIFHIGSDWVPFMEKFDSFLDIQPHFSNELKNIIPQAFTGSSNHLRDPHISIPWYMDLRHYMYNKSLTDKYGIDVPGIKSLSDLIQTAKKLKRKKIPAFQYFSKVPFLFIHTLLPWIYNYNGILFPENSDTLWGDQEKCTEGMHEYFSFLNQYGTPFDFLSKENDFITFMNKETSVFTQTFSWPITTFFRPEMKGEFAETIRKKIRLMNHPFGSKKNLSFIGTSNLAVSKYSAEKNASLKLISFLLSEESQSRYIFSIGNYPSNKKVFKKLLKSISPCAAEINYQLKHSIGIPNTYKFHFINDVFYEMINNVLSSFKNKTYTKNLLKSAMKSMSKKSDYLLSMQR